MSTPDHAQLAGGDTIFLKDSCWPCMRSPAGLSPLTNHDLVGALLRASNLGIKFDETPRQFLLGALEGSYTLSLTLHLPLKPYRLKKSCSLPPETPSYWTTCGNLEHSSHHKKDSDPALVWAERMLLVVTL